MSDLVKCALINDYEKIIDILPRHVILAKTKARVKNRAGKRARRKNRRR